MQVSLFIATYLPFYECHGDVGLLVRREGYIGIGGINAVLPPATGRYHPTISVINHASHAKPEDILIGEVERMLGTKVAQHIHQAMKRKELVCFSDTTSDNFRDVWYGVMLPNIVEELRIPVSYGCPDILTEDDIADQERKEKRAKREIPLEKIKGPLAGMIRKWAKSSGHKTIQVISLDMKSLQRKELRMARIIFDHFKKKETRRKEETEAKKIHYKARAMASA